MILDIINWVAVLLMTIFEYLIFWVVVCVIGAWLGIKPDPTLCFVLLVLFKLNYNKYLLIRPSVSTTTQHRQSNTIIK